MKALVFDTETGGLIPGINALLQVGAAIVEFDERHRMNVIDRFNTTVLGKGEIDEGALRCNKIARDKIPGFAPQEIAMGALLYFITPHATKEEKLFVFGWKVDFDIGFLKESLNPSQRIKFYETVHLPGVDVMSLAGLKMMRVRGEMSNFKLVTVAEKRGIQVDLLSAHEATYDVELTIKVYNSFFPA